MPDQIAGVDQVALQSRRPWRLYTTIAIVIAVIAAWYFGKMNPYLPCAVRSTSVLHKLAPSWPEVPSCEAPAEPPAHK